MDREITKEYSNGEITIVWKPASCIHSTICWRRATGMPQVFNPKERPWIKMEDGETEAIAEQVKKCPSGALSLYYNNAAAEAPEIIAETKVEVVAQGPLLVYGNLTVKGKDGTEIRKHKVTAFCRCGQSANKPFCDGSHISSGFIE